MVGGECGGDDDDGDGGNGAAGVQKVVDGSDVRWESFVVVCGRVEPTFVNRAHTHRHGVERELGNGTAAADPKQRAFLDRLLHVWPV